MQDLRKIATQNCAYQSQTRILCID